jgi:hypothetical protein
MFPVVVLIVVFVSHCIPGYWQAKILYSDSSLAPTLKTNNLFGGTLY